MLDGNWIDMMTIGVGAIGIFVKPAIRKKRCVEPCWIHREAISDFLNAASLAPFTLLFIAPFSKWILDELLNASKVSGIMHSSSHILQAIRGLVEQPAPFETHWTRIVNLANVAHYLAVGEWAQTKMELVVNADQAVLGFATDKIASWDTPNHNLEMLVNELRGFSATHLRPTGWEIAGLGAGLQVVGLHLIDHGTTWED